MPIRRRRFNKRKVKKYVNTAGKIVKRGYNVANKTADLGMKVAKLYRIINSEVHFHTIEGTTNANTTGTVLSLHNISQGDTSTTRTGSSIKPCRLSGYFRVKSGDNTSTNAYVTIRLIKGKGERGTPPTWGTVYEAAGAAPINFQPKLWNNRFNTKVLWQRDVLLNFQGGTTAIEKYIKINVKLFGHIQYTQGASTAEDGGLYLFIASDRDKTTSVDHTVDESLRLTFYDN